LNIKIQKISVRLKGIFKGLLSATNKSKFPQPLAHFLHNFLKNGSFVPQSYFVPYEKARLHFDKFGAVCDQNDEKQSMMIAFFFISRILVGMLLLRPMENRLHVKENSKVLL
jgi:hypothetical protein